MVGLDGLTIREDVTAAVRVFDPAFCDTSGSKVRYAPTRDRDLDNEIPGRPYPQRPSDTGQTLVALPPGGPIWATWQQRFSQMSILQRSSYLCGLYSKKRVPSDTSRML